MLALIAALALAHGLRLALGIPAEAFALTSGRGGIGRPLGLVTHLFVHGSWTHLVMNSVFILAFGTPVVRRLGSDALGAALFFLFFLACGVAAGLAYAGLAGVAPWPLGSPSPWALVGASGAASGLLGGAARTLDARAPLASMASGRVAGMTVAWILANVLLGVSGLTPGAEGVPVAWQAHVFGYLAGLLLIGPMVRLAGPVRPRP